MTLVQDGTTRRRKMLGESVPNIGFRRPQVVPIGGSFSTWGIDRDQFIIEAADARLDQQVLQNYFRQFVGALAEVMIANMPQRIEVMIANMPQRIDEIEGRPVVVRERVP